MRTTIDILNEVLGDELEDQNDINANVQYLTTLGDIQKCMRTYALQIIDEIVVDGNGYHWGDVEWDYEEINKLEDEIRYQ